MELTVRDSARLLNVSEKTIYRWIQQGKLPAFRVNEQYRFHRAQLLEWATRQRINVSAEILCEPELDQSLPGLAEAVRAGGIYYRVGGKDKPAVLAAVVELMPLPPEVDRDFVLEALLTRESLASTGVGNGIALPHVRNPVVLHVPRPLVTVSFLEQPVEFGALDGQPVQVLFTLLSPTVRAHLHTMARILFALRQRSFARRIQQGGSREEILEACGAVDRRLASLATREASTDTPAADPPGRVRRGKCS